MRLLKQTDFACTLLYPHYTRALTRTMSLIAPAHLRADQPQALPSLHSFAYKYLQKL